MFKFLNPLFQILSWLTKLDLATVAKVYSKIEPLVRAFEVDTTKTGKEKFEQIFAVAVLYLPDQYEQVAKDTVEIFVRVVLTIIRIKELFK